jgi:hypothetical protein
MWWTCDHLNSCTGEPGTNTRALQFSQWSSLAASIAALSTMRFGFAIAPIKLATASYGTPRALPRALSIPGTTRDGYRSSATSSIMPLAQRQSFSRCRKTNSPTARESCRPQLRSQHGSRPPRSLSVGGRERISSIACGPVRGRMPQPIRVAFLRRMLRRQFRCSHRDHSYGQGECLPLPSTIACQHRGELRTDPRA